MLMHPASILPRLEKCKAEASCHALFYRHCLIPAVRQNLESPKSLRVVRRESVNTYMRLAVEV